MAEVEEECRDNRRARHDGSGAGVDQPLVTLLLGFFKDGMLSTKHLQQGAEAALNLVNASHDNHSWLMELSRLGGQGKHEGNMYRDFMKRMGRKGGLPDLYEAMVPTNI